MSETIDLDELDQALKADEKDYYSSPAIIANAAKAYLNQQKAQPTDYARARALEFYERITQGMDQDLFSQADFEADETIRQALKGGV